MQHGIPNCAVCHKPMKHARGMVYLCEDDQDSLHKNAFCELLMKEGIDGRQDKDAVARTCSLTDLAIELGRKDSRACVLAWYEALEQKSISSELRINLDFSRANAIAGERYGSKWQWEQTTLAREIFYLRRAVSHPEFDQMHKILKCKCLNNLSNRLRVAGRAIKALECWRRTVELQPNFGMALCNRAKVLANYGEALEDPEGKGLFWWVAHKEASAALAPTATYTSVRDETTRKTTEALKEWIESVLDMGGIAAEGVDPLASQDTAATEEERAYRHWCLVNCLYLNPLNDLGPYTVASTHSTVLATHAVPVDSPDLFQSFYGQMKQEYVSARWSLYEGLTAKTPTSRIKTSLFKRPNRDRRSASQSKRLKPPTGFPILFSTRSGSL